MNGNSYMAVSGIEFIPRKTQYDKAQWGPHCYQFPELFNCLEYEAIKEMCPHIFGSGAVPVNTGYSPIPTANSTRPDGIYPPQPQAQPPAAPGQYANPQQQSPQQSGFYPPAAGQQQSTFTPSQFANQPQAGFQQPGAGSTSIF
jgi:hypothetical protein